MLNIDINGERYITNGTTDEMDRADFGDIIREHMGFEAYKEYKDILWDLENPCGDDYEQIADEYRGMLLDTMNELESVIEGLVGKRLLGTNDTAKLTKDLRRIHGYIYNNL